MDGLDLKFTRSPLDGNFSFDEYGCLVPSRNNLRMEEVAQQVSRQLKADTGLYRKMTDMYARTDVEFTDNPAGNTPTLGAGMKRYGKRPLNVSFKERMGNLTEASASIQAQLNKRERKIVNDQRSYMALYDSLKPAKEEGMEYVTYLVEGDQVMTGGGMDNNSIGDVQKSALDFVKTGNTNGNMDSDPYSKYIVEGALKLRELLEQAGMKPGSLKPAGCSEVRMNQDNDGLIGFPVYDHGWKELTDDIALRLLIQSGVDCRKLVGARATDPRTGESTTTRVVQAIAYVLDHTVISDPAKLPSIVTLLARIQKHGWKEENGDLVPKKSKTRSVYPNAALAGMIEAMVGDPIIKELQRLKVPFMPSLQDKPTRVQMIKELYQAGRAAGYEWLSLDESSYDATVIGKYFATMLYYTFRPFFNAKYYDWFDFAIYCLVYKYIVTDTALDLINSEEFNAAKVSGPWVEVKPFTIFGMTDGLISGAKLTHVGGSYYGGVVIHYAMPKVMGFEPFIGVQAGDDCLWAYPRDRVDFSSMEKTYGPVEDTAKQLGITINKTKQIWHVVNDELVNVFLQDVYHEQSDTWGIGSIFRPLTAVFFSERDKGLSISEQLMAEISRMEQGADSPYAADGVRKWLQMEEFIGLLFKEFGVSAFNKIVESIGDSIEDIAKTIDVGSFTFGISKTDLQNGALKILPIIADVASSMEFKSNLQSALKALGEEPEPALRGEVLESDLGDLDIGDSDDIVAD